MGDRSRTQTYSELLAFLQERGVSLSEYGSSEQGVSLADARAFLPMLQAKGVPLLGIELWRKSGSSYAMKGQEVWVPAVHGAESSHSEALEYLAGVGAGPSDLFAIQLG